MSDAQYIVPGSGIVYDNDDSVAQIIIPGFGIWEDRAALTIAPTPWWSMGNAVQYTKENAATDDTEQWSFGNILSYLEYYVPAVGGGYLKGKLLLLGVGR